MKLKKRFERFFSLNRHKNGGFTLVELIVVIAILAILAGVGIPAYSGYVTKANMQADMTLVSEVANALQLHYYSDPTNAASGYVCITPDGMECLYGGCGKAAMDAAFGEGWEKTLSHKYDGWQYNTSMPSAEDAAKVAKSSYYKNSTPAELVSSFTGLTDALAGMASTAGQDPLDTMKEIGVMTDEEYTAMREQLKKLNVEWENGGDNKAYSTAVSNLLVQNVATEIGSHTFVEEDNPSMLGELAVSYAQIYAWASTGDTEGVAVLEKLNSAIVDENASSRSVVNAVGEAMQTAQAEGSSFSTYLKKHSMDDLYGLSSIMSTVGKWSNGADMTAPGLYSSDSIADAVNPYITAVSTMSGMTEAESSAMAAAVEKGIVVFVTIDGAVCYNIELD